MFLPFLVCGCCYANLDPHGRFQGYHYLMQYLRLHFDQNDILRVVRALAIYRPSLIALQVPLSIEDETFAEKSLQRSLIVRLTPSRSLSHSI